ncbi:MAG: hypothetical protein JXA90_03945 [Planctomycetes bacterium]|nr:hypothetical protein [Planctomycetota bacterium]
MSRDTRRRERLQALVEVIHAVLVSLEEESEERGGASGMQADWSDVIAGVQNRLLSGAEWPARAASRPLERGPSTSAPPHRDRPAPPPPRPAPKGAGPKGGLDTIELFLEEAESRPAPPPSGALSPSSAPAAGAPGGPSGGDTLDDFFGLPPGGPAQGSVPPPPQPSQPPPPPPPPPPPARAMDRAGGESLAPAGGDLDALRDENLRLRRDADGLRDENVRLRRDLEARAPSAAAAPAVDAPLVDALLAALGVSAPPGAGVRREAIAEILSAMANYLAKTRGNLLHVFGGLQIPVQIPDTARVLAGALESSEEMRRHLEDLRECWKILVAGTWNHLFQWCEKVEADFAPERIETQHPGRPDARWEAYKDVYRRTALRDNLAEMLRSRIKAQMRNKLPRFMK